MTTLIDSPYPIDLFRGYDVIEGHWRVIGYIMHTPIGDVTGFWVELS